jgi:two-component system OmpR family response regulator
MFLQFPLPWRPENIDLTSQACFMRSSAMTAGKRGQLDITTIVPQQVNVLVVDDDLDIRTLLAEYLESNGCHAALAADGPGMWQVLDSSQISIVVLDLNLPGIDGLTLCRELRSRSDLPVIMLTARTAALDRIIGLEMGADDYVCKPFEPRELLSRIRSVLRRTQSLGRGKPVAPPNLVRFAGWTLDIAARHLVNAEGVIVALSGAEFRLLKIFLDHPSHILNRDQILNLTQGRDADPFDRSIDLQVSRLRQKLKDDSREPQIIKTVRSEGYVLATQVSVEC